MFTNEMGPIYATAEFRTVAKVENNASFALRIMLRKHGNSVK
jgi:hypothetical protein